MKPSLGDILLPERHVRVVGMGLIVVGFVLPFAVLALRAARWQPPPAAVVAEPAALRPALVILEPGTFMMGSPEDEADRDNDEMLHEVTLTQAFALSRTEITQGQYFEVMGERPVAERTDEYTEELCEAAGVGDDLPVVCVDWLEAVRYCNELSRREGLEAAYVIEGDEVTWLREAPGYRLPTEAEWEYAARAGTRHTWVGTSQLEEVCDYANVADASAKERNPAWGAFSCDDSFPALAPVDARKTNRWLLFGLGGNALEWVWDTYGRYPAGPVRDPVVEEQGAADRVLRGGSWRYAPRSARVASRDGDAPSGRDGLVGFRVVRSWSSAL